MQEDFYRENSYAIITICIVIIIGIAPFGLYHGVTGSLFLSTVNMTIVSVSTAVLVLARKGIALKACAYTISFICTAATIFTIHLTGYYGIYWIYPVALVNFYMLKPRPAIAVNILMLIIISPVLSKLPDTLLMPRILVSFGLVNFFSLVFSSSLYKQRRELARLARMDSLTGAGNRRHLMDNLHEMIAQYLRWKTPVSIIIYDIDAFKKINDTWGHRFGDQVLIDISRLVKNRIRETDKLFRYGGEEFVVLASNTPLENACYLAEQLREIIDSAQLLPDYSVTLSLGVAELKDNESADMWLERADKALYAAKHAGRNRVMASDMHESNVVSISKQTSKQKFSA